MFGHDPGAFRDKGTIQTKGGRLFLIDVGMTPEFDYSKGALLLIDRKDGQDVATSMDASGVAQGSLAGAGAARVVKFAALILDFDGLILDTESPIFEEWRATFRARGHDLGLDVWQHALGTFGTYDPCAHLAELTGEHVRPRGAAAGGAGPQHGPLRGAAPAPGRGRPRRARRERPASRPRSPRAARRPGSKAGSSATASAISSTPSARATTSSA